MCWIVQFSKNERVRWNENLVAICDQWWTVSHSSSLYEFSPLVEEIHGRSAFWWQLQSENFRNIMANITYGLHHWCYQTKKKMLLGFPIVESVKAFIWHVGCTAFNSRWTYILEFQAMCRPVYWGPVDQGKLYVKEWIGR